jgi:hypothetical protein
MGTSLFMMLCVVGEGFLVYCLMHFTLELKLLDRDAGIRPGAENRRILPFPEGLSVEDQVVEVRRRA